MGLLLPEPDEAYEGAGATLAYQLVVQDELAKAEIPAGPSRASPACPQRRDSGHAGKAGQLRLPANSCRSVAPRNFPVSGH
jgi:hypothetical protein